VTVVVCYLVYFITRLSNNDIFEIIVADFISIHTKCKNEDIATFAFSVTCYLQCQIISFCNVKFFTISLSDHQLVMHIVQTIALSTINLYTKSPIIHKERFKFMANWKKSLRIAY